MPFSRDDYVWPKGKENHIPPACFRRNYNARDKAKFNAMVIHIINNNMERENIPMKVKHLFAMHETRCKVKNPCYYEVFITHKDNPFYDFSAPKLASRVANDVKRSCAESVLRVSALVPGSSMTDQEEEEEGEDAVSVSFFQFTLHMNCGENHSLEGEFTKPLTCEDLPHVKPQRGRQRRRSC